MKIPFFYGRYPYDTPHPIFPWNRQYPPVQTEKLKQSVVSFEKLMKEGSQVLSRLSEPQFAYHLMSSAQAGNKQEVERVLKEVSSESSISAQYTPSNLTITIHPKANESPCCELTMSLKWGE